MKVVINKFCADRHTTQSPYSHYAGGPEALVVLAVAALAKAVKLEPIMVLAVDPAGFYSGVVALSESMNLRAEFKPRRAGEAPYVHVLACGELDKQPAKAVELVLYSRQTLEKDGDETVGAGADYELISINARVSEEPEPQHPVSMARNFLGLAGGTKREYTAQQFAESIAYWSRHANLDR